VQQKVAPPLASRTITRISIRSFQKTTMQIPDSAPSVQDSLLAICLFAAFADGEKSEDEREAVRKIAEELGSENLATLSRQILMRKLPLDTVAANLTGREDRMLAYEMALGICEAGGSVSPEETEFLNTLRSLLALGDSDSKAVEAEVAEITHQPVTAPVLVPPPLPESPANPATPENDGMILRYSILNGALELLPETLATVAIIPLQMKMVYRIGKSHGVELDRAHIKEFLTVAGAGLGSQVVEGFARKLMRGFGKKMAGKLAGRAADQITGSAFSFASTYAIGHLAEKYYAGGRRIDTQSLKTSFASLQDKARKLHAQYLPQIQEKAGSLNTSSLMSLVTGSQQV